MIIATSTSCPHYKALTRLRKAKYLPRTGILYLLRVRIISKSLLKKTNTVSILIVFKILKDFTFLDPYYLRMKGCFFSIESESDRR